MVKEDEKYYLLADIGGTSITTVIADERNHFLSNRIESSTKRNLKKEELLQYMVDLFRKTIHAASLEENKIHTLLVGIPTRVNKKKEMIACDNLPTLSHVDFKSELEKLLKIPVFAAPDAFCYAAGELASGEADIYSSFCGVTIGTGIGLAYFCRRRPFWGFDGLAGEIWKSPYLGGILEDYISSHYISSVYEAETGESLMPMEIAEKAIEGNLRARQAYSDFGEHLGFALSYIINILNPECIFLGGSISKSFMLYEQSVNNMLKKYSTPASICIKTSDDPGLKPLLGVKWLYDHYLNSKTERN